MKGTFAAAGALALVVPALAAPPAGIAERTQAPSVFIFQSNRNGDSEIYRQSLDQPGTRAQPLTNNAVPDATPSWSRDGELIVFARGASATGQRANWELFLMRADGTGVEQLTFTPEDEFDPVLSPDNRYVAFERGTEIFVSELGARGEPVNVTQTAGEDGDPSWSPDSTRIAFSTGDGRDADIAIVAIDAPGRVERITSGPERDRDPSWSERSDEIAFVRAAQTKDIWVMHSSGQRQRQLTSGAREDWGPAWTDDGRILFVRRDSPARAPTASDRIWIMNGNGSSQRAVTTGSRPYDDTEPAPQPGVRAAASEWTSFVASAPTAPARAASSHCLYGDQYDNTLKDDQIPYKNCLWGRAGNDVLHGYSGNDYAYGESGNDTVTGGAGADYVYGYPGTDSVWGGLAHDPRVDGGMGVDDRMRGGSGNDTLRAEDGEKDAVISGDLGVDDAYRDENLDPSAISATSH